MLPVQPQSQGAAQIRGFTVFFSAVVSILLIVLIPLRYFQSNLIIKQHILFRYISFIFVFNCTCIKSRRLQMRSTIRWILHSYIFSSLVPVMKNK